MVTLDRGAELTLIVTGQGIERPWIGLGIKEWLQRCDDQRKSDVDALNQRLLAAGLITQLPDPAEDIIDDDPDDQPIEIEGEPGTTPMVSRTRRRANRARHDQLFADWRRAACRFASATPDPSTTATLAIGREPSSGTATDTGTPLTSKIRGLPPPPELVHDPPWFVDSVM